MGDARDIWSIKAALDWTVGYLERKGDENPRLSAEWLLSEATGLRRIELYVNFEKPLSLDERDVLRDYVRRRGAGEPLQYITGEVGFRHIAVKVRPGVLIPRPETEVLVSEALALLPAPAKRYSAEYVGMDLSAASPIASSETPRSATSPDGSGATLPHAFMKRPSGANNGSVQRVSEEPIGLADAVAEAASGSEASVPSEGESALPSEHLLVADICTGSGCIACSMAYEHPGVRVVATDIAPEAVALARENAEALGLSERITVLSCDLGEGIGPKFMGSFDAVVSNPPYVPTAVLEDIPREVADYEPALALDGGEDGLDVFRRLLLWCRDALKPGGGFAFELHETCLERAAGDAEAAGFTGVRVVNDLAGRPRVLVARKNG